MLEKFGKRRVIWLGIATVTAVLALPFAAASQRASSVKKEANGKGTVSTIYPMYTCNPVAESGSLTRRLLPAVPGSAPAGTLVADRSDLGGVAVHERHQQPRCLDQFIACHLAVHAIGGDAGRRPHFHRLHLE